MMKRIKFNCELLSDIVISQNAATEGNQESLDFIPGSNFYGIVANYLYTSDKYKNNHRLLNQALHDKKIRFSDAHPLLDDIRSLRIPAAMFYPKSDNANNDKEYYVHHGISNPDALMKLQLKQCRNGFYKFSNNEGILVPVNKGFSLKSAYDRELRHSQDAQMYGYQSIDKGIVLEFEIAYEDIDSLIMDDIFHALCGNKHVGRSRTAQYGLVKIEQKSEIAEYKPYAMTNCSTASIYADGRLIFLDENYISTFDIRPSHFGFDDYKDKILWDKSQIRTFQYAPWNFKRQARDTERCGIEKGSVIIIQIGEPDQNRQIIEYVGSFQNEGFGKILLNPDFLHYKENGKACYILRKNNPTSSTTSNQKLNQSSDLVLKYIRHKIKEERQEQKIYDRASIFIASHKNIFINEKHTFASQWNAIRSIAQKVNNEQELCFELFDKTIRRDGETLPFAYLTHGIASAKWNEYHRRSILQEFIVELKAQAVNDPEAIPAKKIPLVIINLASRMSKICSKNNIK